MFINTIYNHLFAFYFYFLGGSTLFIETALRKFPAELVTSDKSEGSLELTGHLGDVMKESARIALTVARNHLKLEEPENRFLLQNHIHLHVPEVYQQYGIFQNLI